MDTLRRESMGWVPPTHAPYKAGFCTWMQMFLFSVKQDSILPKSRRWECIAWQLRQLLSLKKV